MYVIIYIVGLLCAFSSLAEANSLRVAPILLDVSAPGATTTLNLRNEGAEKLHVQIRVFRWTGTHTEPTLEPTSDVVVSPPAAALTALNSGGRRLRLANLKLIDGSGATLIQRPGLVGYALGKTSAAWTLSGGDKFARRHGPVRVVAESETGALDAVVAVQPSR